jgi:hypothetical protein
MSVTIINFTATTTSPFVNSSTNNKTYFNGLTSSTSGNYYYNETNGNTKLYVFQRVGDHYGATGSITIPINSTVKIYLVGGGVMEVVIMVVGVVNIIIILFLQQVQKLII